MRELLDSICSPGYRDGLAMLFVMLGLSCLLVRTQRRKRPGQWLMVAAFGILLLTFALGFSASLLGLGRRMTEFVNLSVIRYLIAMPLFFAGAVWESTRYPLKVTGGNPSVPAGGLTPTAQDAVRLKQSLSRRKQELESAQEQLDLQSSEANEAAAKLKETLNLLLISEEKFRILFGSSGDGLLIADLSNGVVEEVNDRLGEMVGYPADLLREKDLSAVFGPRVGSLGSRRLRELADEHEPVEILVDQGGGSVPVELRFSVIEAGEKSTLLAVARDDAAPEVVDGSVNESLSLELENKNEALEEQGRVLKEANRLISERAEKMRVMNEKLLELQTVKDDFISSVSHELRTPLTSIQSFSEILLSNADAEEEVKQEFISIINKESERL
ncbi:MAG: histidine kinase dimerization/phospho-acceptor domain-containing protein, partial [Planctomycetota bacterium]